VQVRAAVGEPLTLDAKTVDGTRVRVSSDHVPVVARKHAASEALLTEQLSRLGGTAYELRRLDAEVIGGPMIPLSVLGELRHRLVAALDAARTARPTHELAPFGVASRMLARARETSGSLPLAGRAGERRGPCVGAPPLPQPLSVEERGAEEVSTRSRVDAPHLHVLCRSLAQLHAALDAGVTHLYAEFHDLRDYRGAVTAARAAAATIYVASLRIHKPGENGLFTALAKHNADGWLVRNLAALAAARERGIPAVADFSLNAANPLTVQWLREQGAERVTVSYDLNRDQLLELADAVHGKGTVPIYSADSANGDSPRESPLEVVVHQHMPMFHMEHCVFCAVMSPGRNKSDCGRPCDRHAVQLRDRVGAEHVLHADIGCRNTLYNATAQSGAEAVQPLAVKGVRHYRVELLADAPANETRRLISLYRDLLAGRIDGGDVWRSLRAESRVGVTRGTLEHPRNPLAIL
jgi:putative protease